MSPQFFVSDLQMMCSRWWEFPLIIFSGDAVRAEANFNEFLLSFIARSKVVWVSMKKLRSGKRSMGFRRAGARARVSQHRARAELAHGPISKIFLFIR